MGNATLHDLTPVLEGAGVRDVARALRVKQAS
jgi:hypothetical protein